MPKKLVNKEEKPIGKVTHYFGGISVAIVKFNRTVKVGETVKFKGASTDFEETIETMQFDTKILKAPRKIRKWELK